MVITSLIKAILGYFVFMFIGANLIGFIVRQIYKAGLTNDLQHLKVVVRHDLKSIDIIISIFFFLVTVAYLYAVYYYFNIGVLICAAIIMIARLPDLLFEIKVGQKINFRTMPKKPFDVFISILSWAVFPLLWYSLYILQSPNSIFPPP